RGLELGETLREGRRRDRSERLAELGEARAAVVRRVQDRHGVTPLEDVRRAADVLGYRLVMPTPRHWAAPASPRAPGSALRRWTSPGGTRSRCGRSPGCPRDLRGCA